MPRDITGDIGSLYANTTGPAYPMYSFNRAAYTFWQGVFEGLVAKGLSEVQAIKWLQSREARSMLDGVTSEMLHDLGYQAGNLEGPNVGEQA